MILLVPSNLGRSMITRLNWLRCLYPWFWSHSSKWCRISCDWPQTELLHGLLYMSDRICCSWQVSLHLPAFFLFFLKDMDLSLFAHFHIPTSASGRGRSERKNKDGLQWFIQKELLFSLVFLCQRWQWCWRWNSTSVSFQILNSDSWADMKR